MILPEPGRPYRWRRRKEARPAEILAAALACFAERGFSATRLDEVAQRAGVTKGTLYLYYENKEDLFKAVVRQAIIPNIQELESVVGDATAPAINLIEQVVCRFRDVIASPAGAIPKIIVSESGNFPDLARFYLKEVVHRGTALVRRILSAGIERGELAATDVEATVFCVVAPLILAALWRHSLGLYETATLDPEALCEIHLRLLRNGLAIRSAGEAGPQAGAP